VRTNYWPDPPGAATCYDFTTTIQRSFITYPVGSTRWTLLMSREYIWTIHSYLCHFASTMPRNLRRAYLSSIL
jgi:hypothetical protein